MRSAGGAPRGAKRQSGSILTTSSIKTGYPTGYPVFILTWQNRTDNAHLGFSAQAENRGALIEERRRRAAWRKAPKRLDSDHQRVVASFVSLAMVFQRKAIAHSRRCIAPRKYCRAARLERVAALCICSLTRLRCIRTRRRSARSPLPAKSHARRACSLASALTTAYCRYQLFAVGSSGHPVFFHNSAESN